MDTSMLAFPKPKDKEKAKSKKIPDRKRKSILTDDLKHCIECGRTGVNIHEIFFGNNRELSKKYKLVIPLCNKLHHNQTDCKGIHFDKKLCLKWQKIGQKAFMQHYNKTIEEFIQIFGRNYL